MTTFVIRTEKSQIVQEYMRSVEERLKGESIVTNPFIGKIITIEDEKHSYYLLHVKPVYPPFYWYGAIGAGGLFLFIGWSYWLIPFAIVFCVGILWTRFPILLQIYISLRKKEYTKEIKNIRLREFLGVQYGFDS